MEARHLDRLGRLLRFIREHQDEAVSRPLKTRAIAREIGVSHTHTGRLLALAEERGLLRRTASGYAFEKIVLEEEIEGKRWLPTTTCNWRSPIKWREVEGQGEWLPTELFSIRPRVDTWIVRFTADEPKTSGYPQGLGSNCMAIVRRLKDPVDARPNDWCLVEAYGRVRSMYREAGGRFVHTLGYEVSALHASEQKVGDVAVIETVIQKRSPALNRLQRHVSEAVSVLIQSGNFRDQDYDPGYVSVRVEKLRRALRVPHQLKLPGLVYD